jgi:hypothetical protein
MFVGLFLRNSFSLRYWRNHLIGIQVATSFAAMHHKRQRNISPPGPQITTQRSFKANRTKILKKQTTKDQLGHARENFNEIKLKCNENTN